MKKELPGLLMVAAAVVVVCLIVGLLYSHQVKLHHDKVRAHGVALTRALSSTELAQLASEPERTRLVNTLLKVQDSEAFAYVAADLKSGQQLFETASAGSIVPRGAIQASADPTTWFGERAVSSPGDGRKIREFFGPLLKGGELAGFVRVGYYENPRGVILSEDISYVALLALPVFLLTALSFFMIRRETRPLARLSEKMDEIAKASGIGGPGGRAPVEYHDFVQRFDQFVQTQQSLVREIEQQKLTAETSSRLLSYKQEKANAVLDAIPEAVLVLGESSVPTYANSKIEPLLGVSLKELIGAAPQQWCREKEVLALLMRIASQGGPVINTTSIEYSPQAHPDRRISVQAFPLFSPRADNMLLGMLVVFREISDEYRARQAGAEFVAHVSHELKVPLSTIAAYSELLMGYATLDEQERVNAVNVIHDETERAAVLINNLLNISKLEAGTLPIHRKRVKMFDLLRDAVDSMGKVALTRDVSLELKVAHDLGSARLDKDLFRIALDNLLSNAIKYSNAGGQVTVSAEMMDDLEIQISVRDQGIGISPEDCGKVFDKYYRSGNQEVAARGGHGLGLFLAKQIVDLHHGRISVSSELGKGTEFTIQVHSQTQQLEGSDRT